MDSIQETAFLNKIFDAAKIYKDNLVGRTFLFVFDGRGIEIIFKRVNFIHLCGVDSSHYPDEFFRRALFRTLKYNEIRYKSYQNERTANLKLDFINRLSSITSSDTFSLEGIVTNTENYKFGITDCAITICLCNDTDKNGNSLPIYVIQSLRVGDCFNKSTSQFIVDAILSRPNCAKEYDKVEFIDKNYNLSSLPELYKNSLADSLR